VLNRRRLAVSVAVPVVAESKGEGGGGGEGGGRGGWERACNHSLHCPTPHHPIKVSEMSYRSCCQRVCVKGGGGRGARDDSWVRETKFMRVT